MNGYQRTPEIEAALIEALSLALKSNPEQRLGQILMNARRTLDNVANIHDETWIELLNEHVDTGRRDAVLAARNAIYDRRCTDPTITPPSSALHDDEDTARLAVNAAWDAIYNAGWVAAERAYGCGPQ